MNISGLPVLKQGTRKKSVTTTDEKGVVIHEKGVVIHEKGAVIHEKGVVISHW